MAISVTPDNFSQEVLKSNIPVVVDVFASWCGPCQVVAPIVEELSKELEGSIKFVTLNVDEARDLSIQYGVTSVPTFLFIKNGNVVAKETGYKSKEDLKSLVKTHLS